MVPARELLQDACSCYLTKEPHCSGQQLIEPTVVIGTSLFARN